MTSTAERQHTALQLAHACVLLSWPQNPHSRVQHVCVRVCCVCVYRVAHLCSKRSSQMMQLCKNAARLLSILPLESDATRTVKSGGQEHHSGLL